MKIKGTTIAIWVLSVGLVVSNLWWLYVVFDTAVSYTYLQQTYDEHHQALGQLLAVVPAATDPAATRESVLGAAQDAAGDNDPFEEEGFLWIGRLGYRFDDDGRLVEVRTTWSPF